MTSADSSNGARRPRIGPPERVGVWTGVALVALLGGGFAVGGFIPPPGPGESAAEIASHYRDNVDLRRIGVIMLILGGTLLIPFGGVISDQLRRVEGIGATARLTQFGAACVAAGLMMTFGSVLLVALMRPDFPDTTYQTLNSLSFMAWIGLWQPGALQAAATAAAILSDRSETPVFPRWVGWYSAWMAFGSLMGSLIPFFTHGPFAWNGFIGFFVAATPFFTWFLVMIYQLRRNLARDEEPALTAVAIGDGAGVAERRAVT